MQRADSAVELVGERSREQALAEQRRAAEARGDIVVLDNAVVKPEGGGAVAGQSGSGSFVECAGLPQLLEDAGVADWLPAARAWCEKQGYDSVAEIKETGAGGELAAALGLKPGKQRLVQGRVAAWEDELPAAGRGGSQKRARQS